MLVVGSCDLVDEFERSCRPVTGSLIREDLPLEQPTRFRLAINKKTLETLGLTMPPAMLMRADEVVD
jgi:hypothetical protein